MLDRMPKAHEIQLFLQPPESWNPLTVMESLFVQTEFQSKLEIPVVRPHDQLQITIYDFFVYKMYFRLFKRTPDPGGLSYFSNALLNNQQPIEVFRSFIYSDEFKEKHSDLFLVDQ